MTWLCKYCGGTERHNRRACHMRDKWKDPGFRERRAEGVRAKWKDSEFNPLVLLTDTERLDYDVLRKAGYSRDEALLSIRRHDLIRAEAAE